MLEPYFAVVEIQINEGTPSSPAVEFVTTEDAAVGLLYSKLGYAYQNQRDYTAVVILDEKGLNMTSKMNIKNYIDNREEKEPVFSFVEIQINDGVRTAAPVNVQVGAEAESVIMQAYHNALSYAWNVKRNYTEAVVVQTDGLNRRMECIDFMPEPEPQPEQGE